MPYRCGFKRDNKHKGDKKWISIWRISLLRLMIRPLCSGQRLVTYKYECILILVGNRCYQQDEQALDGLH